MPALADVDQLLASQEAAPAEPAVADPEVAEAAGADVSNVGAIPDVAENGAVVEPGETASEQAYGDKPTAQSGEVDGGMYEPGDYRAACEAAGTADKWDDRYLGGYTSASQFEQPYDLGYDMTFKLKPGHSASQALKDFIAGPTVADWRTVAVALEMNEIRDSMGDGKFDELFGSINGAQDAHIPRSQRMQISVAMYTIPFGSQMEALSEAHDEGLDSTSDQAPAPALAAQVEDKPLEGGVTAPAPELVADEMGIERGQEFV